MTPRARRCVVCREDGAEVWLMCDRCYRAFDKADGPFTAAVWAANQAWRFAEKQFSGARDSSVATARRSAAAKARHPPRKGPR